MKKYLFCMAAFAAALVSCKKESFKDNNSDGKVLMTVTASAVDTKTFVSTEDGGLTYAPSWSKGDAIHVLEFIDGVLSQEANSSALGENSQEAFFSVSLEPKDAGNFKYYAVYPAKSYDVGGTGENKFYRLQLPENQTFTADSFGADADLLISGPMAAGLEAQPSELKLKFKRIGSAARITVKGMTAGEKIASVNISTTEGYISGYSKYDPVTGVWEGTYGSSKKSISLTPSPDQTYVTDGSDDIWVRLYPITIRENLSIEITTDKAIYSKTINPSASGRTIEFADGGLTTFPVSGLQRELIAPESPVYTLAFMQLESSDPYNTYTKEHSYTCDGVEWKIWGNQAQGAYLRFGGQNTTATDKTITSAGVISGEVTYVVMNHEGIKNGSNTTMTINSMSIKVSSSPSFPENDTEVITINNPDLSTGELNFEFDDSHENSYYQVVMNYQVSASGSARNSYLWLNNVEFFTGVVAPKYDITISNEITNGSVTAAPSRAKAGATVLLTATPNDGYDFTSYNVMCGDSPVSVANDGTFTMPEGNVVVNAVFTEKTKYNVNLSQTTGGTISSDLTQAWAGQIVTLSKELTSGYAFKAWNVRYGAGNTPVEVAEDKFTMPAAAVTASAVFIPTLTVSPMKPTKKESTAGSWDFTVTTIATDWEVSVPNDQDWATVEKVGAGFRINYTANELETESTDDRSVVISVTSAQAEKTGDQAIQITFSQSGKEYIAPGTGYVRVSNVSDLAAGMTVVFGCASNNAAAGAIAVINGSVKDYLLKEDANIVDNILMSNSAKEYVLGGSTDAWTFTSDEGQLGSTAARKLTVNTKANNYVGTWKISIDGDGNAKITSTTAANGSIQYNATSGQERFLNYASDQTAIQIYTLNDGKSSRNVSFTASEATADMWNGKSTSVLGLTGDAEGDKTYSSSDETVATINNAGVISLKKVGETKITVEIAATETFRKGTASYTLRVVDNTPVLTLNTSSVDVAASAAANATIPGAYSLSHAVDGDVSVSRDGNITAASVAAGTVTYSISENTLESPVASHITLTLNAIPYTITVNQAGAGKTSLSAPGAITVGTKKPTSVSASWTSPSSTTGITGYEWIISTASTSSAAESSYVYKGSVSGSSTLTFTKDGTFTTGTTYYVYVRSVGNEATTTPSSYVRSDSFQVKAAQTYSSTFNSNSWGVATGGTISWTCDKKAYQYSNPNVQVTSSYSGAGATTTNSYSNITKIRIKALTTKSGAGNITVKVGTGAAQKICSLSKNQTATFYELTFDTPVSGKVTFVVNCSTNSMYVQAAEIMAD